MNVLGIDVGFTKANPIGFAHVEFFPSGKPVLHETRFFAPKAVNWTEAVDEISRYLDRAIACPFGLIAYEMPHVEKNAQTAIKLAHVGGAIRAFAVNENIPVIAVQPQQAKIALAGGGNADKALMIKAARVKFGVVISKDEADALGVALAGYLLYTGKEKAA